MLMLAHYCCPDASSMLCAFLCLVQEIDVLSKKDPRYINRCQASGQFYALNSFMLKACSHCKIFSGFGEVVFSAQPQSPGNREWNGAFSTARHRTNRRAAESVCLPYHRDDEQRNQMACPMNSSHSMQGMSSPSRQHSLGHSPPRCAFPAASFDAFTYFDALATCLSQPKNALLLLRLLRSGRLCLGPSSRDTLCKPKTHCSPGQHGLRRPSTYLAAYFTCVLHVSRSASLPLPVLMP